MSFFFNQFGGGGGGGFPFDFDGGGNIANSTRNAK